MDGTGTALFFLHLTRMGGKWKGEASWQGQDRVVEELGTPPGCSELLHIQAHPFMSLVPHSPAQLRKERTKCFKAREKLCVHRCKCLPGVEGCDDCPGTLQPWAAKEWISHLSEVLKTLHEAVGNHWIKTSCGSAKCIHLFWNLSYGKNQIKCAGESVSDWGKMQSW